MLDGTNIIEVTPSQLTYVDENQQKQVIEFAACYEQYLSRWSEPDRIEQFKKINMLDDERLEKSLTRLRQVKEIARRCPLNPPWCEDGPYIEFYTNPFTRFRFLATDIYGKILMLISEGGWRTFDLS